MERLQEFPIAVGLLSELLMVKDEVQSSIMLKEGDNSNSLSRESAAIGLSDTLQLKIMISGKVPAIIGGIVSTVHV